MSDFDPGNSVNCVLLDVNLYIGPLYLRESPPTLSIKQYIQCHGNSENQGISLKTYVYNVTGTSRIDCGNFLCIFPSAIFFVYKQTVLFIYNLSTI